MNEVACGHKNRRNPVKVDNSEFNKKIKRLGYEHVLSNTEFDVIKSLVKEMFDDDNVDLAKIYLAQYIDS